MEPRKAKAAILITAVSALLIVATCLFFIFSPNIGRSVKGKPIFTMHESQSSETADSGEDQAEISDADRTELEAKRLLEEARRLAGQEEYYEAVGKLYQCYVLDISDEVKDECDEVFGQIQELLADNEPKTGTELERTFQFQGGSDLIITAQSGPAEMTVVNTDDPSKYVRFYVRYGETAIIYLPSQSEYEVTYKIGLIWFDNDLGFGEFYQEGDLGVLECNYSDDGSWISNSVWSGTI